MTSLENNLRIKLLKALDITFDYSVPQDYFDHVCESIRDLPEPYNVARFVWVYPNGSLFGKPFPVTDETDSIFQSVLDDDYLSVDDLLEMVRKGG